MGCQFIMPGDYTDNSFTSCEGEAAIAPGLYPQPDGSTSTFKQLYTGTAADGAPYTIGDSATPSAPFSTPATSNCRSSLRFVLAAWQRGLRLTFLPPIRPGRDRLVHLERRDQSRRRGRCVCHGRRRLRCGIGQRQSVWPASLANVSGRACRLIGRKLRDVGRRRYVGCRASLGHQQGARGRRGRRERAVCRRRRRRCPHALKLPPIANLAYSLDYFLPSPCSASSPLLPPSLLPCR